MSHPYDYHSRSGSGNREPGPTFHFYGDVTIHGFILQGNAQGDLFGSLQSTVPPAATSPAADSTEGVRDRNPPSNTGRSTRNAAASRAGNPLQSNSDAPVVRDRFEDVRGMGGSDNGSIRLPEVNYSNPDVQRNNSGECSRPTVCTECRARGDGRECQGSTVADTSGNPTLDERALPPKGFINKVELFFRARPKKAKRSFLGRLLKLGRQAGPSC